MYVVKAIQDPNTIIIDADDLCNDPASILRGFCQNMGIPFSDDLLQWEAGEDVVNEWVAVKMFVMGNSMIGYYKNAFESTAFKKSGPVPDLTAEEQLTVDGMMPAYNQLYESRMKPE